VCQPAIKKIGSSTFIDPKWGYCRIWDFENPNRFAEASFGRFTTEEIYGEKSIFLGGLPKNTLCAPEAQLVFG
jgi:hypothetical protein